MKKAFHVVFFLLLISILLGACNSDPSKKAKPSSVGSPYDLLVVCSHENWATELKDSIESVMGAPVEMINQLEPIFTVRRIAPNNFSGLLPRSRNILNITTGDQYEQPAMTAQYNVYAAPQLIVTLLGKDRQSVLDYMYEHREELTAIFEIAERDRSIALNKQYGEKRIDQEIKDMFGFNITIPKGYTIRNKGQNFMWLSCEYPTASQGIIIYKYPYQNKENFLTEALVQNRNKFVSQVPGENPGSYMITYDDLTPSLKHLRIHGRYWAEMRGFWDVKGDYMGGPFVNYSTLDTESKMVVSIDCYVFSPDKPKRNFLRQLEHIMYSVAFPGDVIPDDHDTSSEEKQAKASSIGNPYDLLVVCSHEKWADEIGDTVQSIFEIPVEMTNQYEPALSITRIAPNNFSGLLPRNKNILNITTGDQYEEVSIKTQYDVYAAPQLIVTVSGRDSKSIAEYMSTYGEGLRTAYEVAERNRSIALNSQYGEKKIDAQIKEMFGLDIKTPKGFKVRDVKEDFMWVSCEYPTASQGFVIYRYPYQDKEAFMEKSLIQHRNEFVSLIPGENPDSHMITYDELYPTIKHMRINDRYWAEMRGFWDVKNDYMGGPFVNYTTLDTENKMVVSIDCYVYSPDKPKRNFLKQLEHMVYSAELPESWKDKSLGMLF